MVMDQIEDLKRQYTDKFVLVDGQRPELARFRDVVGRVKTVNMSGRALVEFDDYHLNTGWYDIDPQFLKVVDEPPPKPKKEEAPAKKPAGEVAAVAGAKAAAKPQAKPAGGKPSVADILAAARGGDAPAAKAAVPKKEEGAAPAKVDRSKMSVADMIAAAKSGGAKGAAPAVEAKTQAAAEAAEEVVAEVESGEVDSAGGESVAAPAKAHSGEKIDKSSMSIADMVAWCREHDAK